MTRAKRFKNNKFNEPFVGVYKSLLNSAAFLNLSPHACKLLFELFSQYQGDNNGNLTLAWTVVSKRGVRSRTTLWRCKQELLDGGFIYVTRKGAFPSKTELLALTCFPLDVSNKFDPEALACFTPKKYLKV